MVALLSIVSVIAVAPIEGVVLDPSGRPVQGAAVGNTFVISSNAPKAQIGYGEAPQVTDVNGRFTLDSSVLYNKTLVAVKENLAGLVEVGSSTRRVTLRLKPLQKVSLDIVNQDRLPTKEPSVSVTFNENVIGYCSGQWGLSRIQVPASTLGVTVIAAGSRMASGNIQNGKLRLPVLAAEWAKLIGRKAPSITPTDTTPGFKVSSLKGKWIVLDFWATWCGPCIQKMPEWFELYETMKSKRDKFEIIAFHSPDGTSYAATESSVNTIVKRNWAGTKPPFPLFFDKTGKTQRAFGIEAYPTTLLISPDGKVVGTVTPKEMLARLERL
jgi:thiol-disulfide isomerase/thioredoxin